MSAISRADAGSNRTIKAILFIYVFSSVMAALIAASLTLWLPHVHLEILKVNADNVVLAKETTPGEVLYNQFLRMFENPVSALVNSNFMALLSWSVAFGMALRHASEATRNIIADMSQATSKIVAWIVQLAPIGVFGIFSDVLVNSGFTELTRYLQLIIILLIAFAVITFVYFPVVGIVVNRKNPFPLLFKCLAISGIPAFFSRSSAANIPVNLEACNAFGLSKKVSSFTIPLGANINLTAASATITVLSITVALSLGIQVGLITAVLTSVVAAACALGASGIPGGSLIMIPIAASLFGISPEIASRMVAIGFLIAVVQDSFETAINSAGDLYFTTLVCEKYHAIADDDGA